jgi:hydroxyacylglutathione hydrolase
MPTLDELSGTTPYGFREVAPGLAATALDGVRLIDVREPSEFSDQLGHIAGAELVPLATYLLICRSGGRSANATGWLANQGFTSAFNLSGGMIAWNQAGLAVER